MTNLDSILKSRDIPSAGEWIRKLWYIYTMAYYSAIKLKDAYALEEKL